MDSAATLFPAKRFRAELEEFRSSLSESELAAYWWIVAEDDAASVAVVDGAVVGVAGVHAGDLHPQRAWAAVVVGTSWRRRGIGTALYADLSGRSSLPLRGKVESTDSAAAAFATSVGLHTLVRSYVVRVPARAKVPEPELPRDVHVETLPLPPSNEVRSAVAALYRRIHAWDPVGPDSDDAISEALFSDVVVGSVAVGGDTIVGVALGHDGGPGNPVETAMVGTVAPDTQPDAPITAALLSALLRSAGDLEVEVDEGVGAHTELIQVLRRTSGVSWQPPTLLLGSA